MTSSAHFCGPIILGSILQNSVRPRLDWSHRRNGAVEMEVVYSVPPQLGRQSSVPMTWKRAKELDFLDFILELILRLASEKLKIE